MNGILCGESFSYRRCNHESQFHSIATVWVAKMNRKAKSVVWFLSLCGCHFSALIWRKQFTQGARVNENECDRQRVPTSAKAKSKAIARMLHETVRIKLCTQYCGNYPVIVLVGVRGLRSAGKNIKCSIGTRANRKVFDWRFIHSSSSSAEHFSLQLPFLVLWLLLWILAHCKNNFWHLCWRHQWHCIVHSMKNVFSVRQEQCLKII